MKSLPHFDSKLKYVQITLFHLEIFDSINGSEEFSASLSVGKRTRKHFEMIWCIFYD